MISYQEKEFLMVQKFLNDNDRKMSEAIHHDEHFTEFKDVTTYEELVCYVYDCGYDIDVSVEDFLSPQELQYLDEHEKNIERQFADKVKLDKKGLEFLIIATILQCVRQMLQPKLKLQNRVSDREGSDQAKDTYADKIKKTEQEEDEKTERYHESYAHICNLSYRVPYDISIDKTQGLGIGGKVHRYRTLGHDPWLGLLFGTANILTNTITITRRKVFCESYHVDQRLSHNVYHVEKANTMTMLSKSMERYQENDKAVKAALIKQCYHIASDKITKAGIPLPFIQLIFSPEIVEKLMNHHIDYYNASTAVKQFVFTEAINEIIAVAYRIALMMEDVKGYKDAAERDWKRIVKFIGEQHLFSGKKELDEVKTRKILMYANIYASGINIVTTAVAACYGTQTGNMEVVNKAMESIDVGGILATVVNLIKDRRFITKIKAEYIDHMLHEEWERKTKAGSSI